MRTPPLLTPVLVSAGAQLLHVGGAVLPGDGWPGLPAALAVAQLGGREDAADARQHHGDAQVLPRRQEHQQQTLLLAVTVTGPREYRHQLRSEEDQSLKV